MVNSLRKGKGFEREVAKLLTDIFGVEFKRVPMSGAFSTTQHTKNQVFKGDVFTEDKVFNKKYNVVIECKRIKKLPKHSYDTTSDFINFVNLSVVKKWLEQCAKESEPKDCWLFYKEDYEPIKIIRGLFSDNNGYLFLSPLSVEEFKDKVVQKRVPRKLRMMKEGERER